MNARDTRRQTAPNATGRAMRSLAFGPGAGEEVPRTMSQNILDVRINHAKSVQHSCWQALQRVTLRPMRLHSVHGKATGRSSQRRTVSFGQTTHVLGCLVEHIGVARKRRWGSQVCLVLNFLTIYIPEDKLQRPDSFFNKLPRPALISNNVPSRRLYYSVRQLYQKPKTRDYSKCACPLWPKELRGIRRQSLSVDDQEGRDLPQVLKCGESGKSTPQRPRRQLLRLSG